MPKDNKFCSAKHCFNCRKSSRDLTFFKFPKGEYRLLLKDDPLLHAGIYASILASSFHHNNQL